MPTPDGAALRDLLVRVAQHDERAFDTVYRSQRQRILSLLVIQFPVLREQAEDIAQETFIRVWATAPRLYEPRVDGLAWVLTIAANMARDACRHHEVVSRRHQELAEQANEFDVEPDTLDALALRDELAYHRATLIEAVRSRPRCRETLEYLLDAPDMTARECAARMGVNVSTVKNHRHQLRVLARQGVGGC